MAKFNEAERRIAKFLSGFPFIKKWLKIIYSFINYLWYQKDYKQKAKRDMYCFSLKGLESFFGYYDKSPLNANGYVLCHFSDFPTHKKPDPDVPLNVGLFTPENYLSPKYIVETHAYNWQQGARLQWLNDEVFIFNDVNPHEEQYISRVLSTESPDEIKRFSFPVQDAYKTDYFLSLNYQRLMTLRPDYGYRNLPALTKAEIQNLAVDGIWFIDYESGTGNLMISLERIVHTHYKKIFENSDHYVNHVMISPDGNHFIFLHRFVVNGKRYDRLMLSERDGKKLTVLADNNMVSHCCWIDKDTILGYLNNSEGNAGFYLINIHTAELIPYANGTLDSQGDGHPHANGNWFVSDSYPDKARMQHLTLNSLKRDESIKMGEFFHGFKYNEETRCDLHPRFSACGQKVLFDSVFNGKRSLYMMELDI